MENIIQFISSSDLEQIHLPEPAHKVLPKWYKEMPYSMLEKKDNLKIHKGKGNKVKKIFTESSISSIDTDLTIKRCMPVFDSMSLGYFLKVPGDIEVYKTSIGEEKFSAFSWSPLGPVQSHSMEQVKGYPHNGIHKLGLPKFINPWIIKTSPGYSCLLIPPMHRDAKFSILPGVVDTDTFDFPINFPFTLTDPDFEGTIEGGTPMVQVIPFKRDEFSHEVYSGYDYVQKYPDTTLFQEEFPDSYKNDNWERKKYL